MSAKVVAAPAFLGVAESLIDEVLEHLGALAPLPDRSFVFGSNMQLLGALVKQWEGKVDIIAVLVPWPGGDMLDAASMIVENEGFEPDSLLWVCGNANVQHLGPGWRAVSVSEAKGARAIAEAIAPELLP